MNDKLEQILNKQIDYYGYMVEKNSHKLLYINNNLKDALKLHDQSYIGKNCYEVLNHLDKPCEYCIKDELEINQTSRRYLNSNVYDVCCISNESVTEIDGVATFSSTSYDITSEVNEIHSLKESSTFNNTIVDCAKTLLDRDNTNDSMETLLKIICEYYDGELALIYERNDFTKMSRVEHFYSTPNATNITKKDIEPYNFETISTWNQLLEDSTHIFLQHSCDNLNLYNYPKLFLKEEGSNLLIVPLKYKVSATKTKTLGVIEVKDIKQNLDNFQLLTTISAFVVNNMNIIMSNKELKEKVEALSSISSVNLVIRNCVETLMVDNNSMAVDGLLMTISNHFGADGTYILQKDDSNANSLVKDHILSSTNSPVYDNLCELTFNQLDTWYNNFEYRGLAYFTNVVNNLPIISNEVQILTDNNINSFALTTIGTSDNVSGMLFLCNPTQNTNDLGLLNTVTMFLVNYISRHKLVQDLEYLSYTDELTGLYNRNYYMNCIEKLRHAPNKPIAVIFADVNGLKRANDNFGHELGDTLIKWCGNFFRRLGCDLVFRIGGDEFICFFENITEQEFQDKVDDINEHLYNYGDVHVSIGHIWSSSSRDIDELIKESDKLMYEQKQKYYANKRNDRRATVEELNDFQRSIINLRSELS